MDSHYTIGSMNIDEQKRTFHVFMRVTVWSSGLLAALLMFLTLHFCAGVAWFPALGVAFVLGVATGLALKMKSAWYATVFGLTVLGGAIGVLKIIVQALIA